MSTAAKAVDQQVKDELVRLVFRRDRALFDTIKPATYHFVIRTAWYAIFNPQMSRREKQKHHSVIRNIFEIFSSNEAREVIRAAVPEGRLEQVLKESALLLPKIEERRQLVVPVMGGGLLPGALVYSHLRRKGMAEGAAFLGCTRYDVGKNHYRPGKVYATRSDIRILRRSPGRSILVVDDTIESETTIRAVVGFMKRLGVRKFDFACFRGFSCFGNSPFDKGEPVIIKVET